MHFARHSRWICWVCVCALADPKADRRFSHRNSSGMFREIKFFNLPLLHSPNVPKVIFHPHILQCFDFLLCLRRGKCKKYHRAAVFWIMRSASAALERLFKTVVFRLRRNHEYSFICALHAAKYQILHFLFLQTQGFRSTFSLFVFRKTCCADWSEVNQSAVKLFVLCNWPLNQLFFN